MSEQPGRHSDQFNLRLPDGMRDRLKAKAEANKRSMNAEIVARLELTMGPEMPEDPKSLDLAVDQTAMVAFDKVFELVSILLRKDINPKYIDMFTDGLLRVAAKSKAEEGASDARAGQRRIDIDDREPGDAKPE